MNYFYTDPLAAAWMLKHFGMRFPCNGVNHQYKEYGIGGLVAQLGGKKTRQKVFERFFIHSDSLNLLEPKIGDVGCDEKGYPCSRDDGQWWGWDGEPIVSARIIQRNGISFMWPEHD